MWIYTPNVTLSVIKKPGDVQLTVRTRRREDLEWLQEHGLAMGEIIPTPQADYPFRAMVHPVLFSGWLSVEVLNIDYPNVKAATMERSGPDRERVYHNVHSATQGLQAPRVAPNYLQWYMPEPDESDDVDEWPGGDDEDLME